MPDILFVAAKTRTVSPSKSTRGQLMTPDGRQKWDPLRCRVDERYIDSIGFPNIR